jgi:ubiquinone/menaquinone biosynthesis C-methylase UbiE
MTRPGTLIRWNAVQSLLQKSIVENITVLDIGAFDGYILGELKKEINFVPLLLDINSKGLEIAKTKGISPFLGSGTQIPLKNESADLALCLDVIEHIYDDRALIKEITRVLKEDGILVTSTPVADRKLIFFMSAEEMKQIHLQWGHVKPGYTSQELQYLFREANLKIVSAAQYFNILSRYLYYLLFVCHLSIPHKVRQVLFKMGLLSERFVRIGGFEHLIVAKKMSE